MEYIFFSTIRYKSVETFVKNNTFLKELRNTFCWSIAKPPLPFETLSDTGTWLQHWKVGRGNMRTGFSRTTFVPACLNYIFHCDKHTQHHNLLVKMRTRNIYMFQYTQIISSDFFLTEPAGPNPRKVTRMRIVDIVLDCDSLRLCWHWLNAITITRTV